MESLGLYIQVPFCASKCSFCNFSSTVRPATEFEAYCGAVAEEIDRLPAFYEKKGIGEHILAMPVETLYFGGGTPSLFGGQRLSKLLEALKRRFGLKDALEFTMEVAPGSVDSEILNHVGELRVNRLSIGAQTFDDRELRSVGRLHSSEDTRQLVREARRAGLLNISLDLIAGLPHQTLVTWSETLSEAISLNPGHISVYLFEIDGNSVLGREKLNGGTRIHANAVPSEDFMADAYEMARDRLSREGYKQYEISNFARPGRESRHNQKYWNLEPYLGLGAGAHSFSGEMRWSNETDVGAYQAILARGESPLTDVRKLSSKDQIEEFFFLGLRQRAGVDLDVARQRWGTARLDPWGAAIASLARDGWIETRADCIRLSDRALLVSNEIFQQFIT
jgi:oxygen-independent coproporphyrinogen III oxidase